MSYNDVNSDDWLELITYHYKVIRIALKICWNWTKFLFTYPEPWCTTVAFEQIFTCVILLFI